MAPTAVGWNVRGTVRSRSKTAKYSHLTALADALPGTLEIFEADLKTPGSYDAAVRGADYVFHLASPVVFEADDPQKEILEPALNGTRNLLSSAVKSKDTIKRVVVTSTIVAVYAPMGERDPPLNGTAYTATDWNRCSTLAEQPYCFAKVKAEEAAFEVAKAEGLDLVTLLPSLVLGPVLSANIDASTFSIAWFKSLLETGTVPNQFGHQVDVRDLAKANILAAEVPGAAGRYIISLPKAPLLSKAVGWLQERFPAVGVKAVTGDSPPPYLVDGSKAARELGLVLTPVRSSYIDMVTTMIQLGIVSGKRKLES